MIPDEDYTGQWLEDLLLERYIMPQETALLLLGGDNGDPAADSAGITSAQFQRYQATVQRQRNDEPGRVDVFYGNPNKIHVSIGDWTTGIYRFRVNPDFGHAVIKHGKIIEWELLTELTANRLREYDLAVVEARKRGNSVDPAAKFGYTLVPGYLVFYEFSAVPGNFSLYYSGDGGLLFGNHQGSILFEGNQITSWRYLGPDRKRLRIFRTE